MYSCIDIFLFLSFNIIFKAKIILLYYCIIDNKISINNLSNEHYCIIYYINYIINMVSLSAHGTMGTI